MSFDLLNMMGDDDLEDELINSAFVNVEIDKAFERSLQEDNISIEELLSQAPWNQLEIENEDEYDAFKYYINLSIDEWEPTDIKRFIDVSDEDCERMLNAFDWKSRRLAFIKYQEWLRRKESEIAHKEQISAFRDTQADLLKTASSATLSLIGKLSQRINALEPEEIKAADIPRFVSAVSDFIDMTTDAQAKFLTVNELLALYEDDLDAAQVREHINQAKATSTHGKA